MQKTDFRQGLMQHFSRPDDPALWGKQEPPNEGSGALRDAPVWFTYWGISSQGRATVRGDDIVDC
jgi:hypothetical protein